jgi:peptide/nickel transport system permease protein
MLSAFALAIPTSLFLGVISAYRRNKPVDHISRIVALFGVSTPSFWIGLVLIIIFAFNLNILPSSGMVFPWADPAEIDGISSQAGVLVESFKHLIMPAVALGTLRMAAITRVERSAMLEQLGRDYVKLARAYGVTDSKILRKHAFRNAQLPIITLIGLDIGAALGGSVVIEIVFNINGMGSLIITAINSQDIPLVMGTTLAYAIVFLVFVVITDISYAYIDPRVSYDRGE